MIWCVSMARYVVKKHLFTFYVNYFTFIFLLLLLHLLKHLTPLSPIDQGDDDLIVVHDALEFGRCHLAIAVKY